MPTHTHTVYVWCVREKQCTKAKCIQANATPNLLERHKSMSMSMSNSLTFILLQKRWMLPYMLLDTI